MYPFIDPEWTERLLETEDIDPEIPINCHANISPYLFDEKRFSQKGLRLGKKEREYIFIVFR